MSIGAGRPQNSKTPVWRSKPAAKVRAYRFLMPNHVHLVDQGDRSRDLALASIMDLSP